jgi:hypothetical protein
MTSTELKRTPEVTTLTRFYVFLNGMVIVHGMKTYVGVELQLHSYYQTWFWIETNG